VDDRRRPLADRGQTPTWLVGLAVLLLIAVMVLWPVVTGRTLTEWMRDVSGAAVRWLGA
jgi:hypothetical protein